MATILVLDSHPVMRRLLSLQLHRRDHVVLLARNQEEALQTLQQPVDLLIAAISSEEEGRRLLSALQDQRALAELPVILIAPLSQGYLRQQMLQEGADVFLTRPTSSWQLSNAVQELLYPRSETVPELFQQPLAANF